MEILLDWLDSQSGERLFGYGVVFIWTMYYVMQGLVYIFQSVFRRKK